MMTGSIMAHDESFKVCLTSARLLLGGGVTFSLRIISHQVNHSEAPSKMPGKMPAAAITPPERPLSCPALTIMGSSSSSQARPGPRCQPRRNRERGQQREAVGAIDHVLRQDLCIEQVRVVPQGHAAEQQGKGNRHAQGHDAQQGAQEDGDGHDRLF
jgi:hypothetical protein